MALRFITLCLFAALIASCSHDVSIEQPFEGSVTGKVDLYQSSAQTMLDEPVAGATISLNDTGATTHSTSDGRWSFPSVTPGTYEVTISKEGFGTTKLFNVQVAPGAVCYAPNAYLDTIPAGTVL